MMHLKKTSLFLFASMIILLTACPGSDDGKKQTAKEIATANLTKGAWKVSLDGTSTEIGSTESYQNIVLTFSSNGKYTMTESDGVTCAINKPAVSVNGDWILNEAGNEITFDGVKTIKITTISDTNFMFNFEGKLNIKCNEDGTINYSMVH